MIPNRRDFRCLLSCSLCMVFFLCRQSPAQSTADVPSLIQDLSSDKRTVRVHAERELISRGESVIPELETTRTNEPATALKLEQIKRKIQRTASLKSLNGSSVDFDGPRSMTLQKVAAELSRQSGNRVGFDFPEVQREIQIAAGQKPFWQWVDEISRAADLGWKMTHDQLVFSNTERSKNDHSTTVKCLRVGVSIHGQRQSFRRRQSNRLVRADIRIDVEPQVLPYFAKIFDGDYSFRVGDQTLPVFNPEARRELLFQGAQTISYTVDFQSASELQGLKGQLEGACTLFCAARSRRIALPLKTGSSDSSQRVIVRNVVSTESQLQVDLITLMPQEVDVFQSYRLPMLHRNAWLEGPDGQRVNPVSNAILRAVGTDHLVRFLFPLQQNADGWSIVYEMPELMTELPVEFTVQQIELPN